MCIARAPSSDGRWNCSWCLLPRGSWGIHGAEGGHTPEFPGDEGLCVTRGLIPGQPCSEPWLETDGMFLHSGTVETAQEQRKLWGFFSPFCFTIYVQKPFLSSTATGSMWGLQLNCGSLSFFCFLYSKTLQRMYLYSVSSFLFTKCLLHFVVSLSSSSLQRNN